MVMTDRIDGLSASVAVKAPVRVATTTAITLYGLQTVDGISLVANDRILVKNQVNAKENGIYVVTTANWYRAKDFDGARDAVTGTLVYVVNGSTQADTYYRLTTTENPIFFGVHDITFATAILAGNYLILAQEAAEQAQDAAVLAQEAAGNTIMPYLSATALGFDSTGATGNGAKLNALFTTYPNGFTLILDARGGIYKFGDVPVDDNGVRYRVLGLGENTTTITYTATNDDHVRIRQNDIAWLDMSWDGTALYDAGVHTPSFFVLGYNSQAGGSGFTNSARNFQARGLVFKLPGKFIDHVQGVAMNLKIRGSRIKGPLIYGRGTSEALPYKGGIDQQNGRFDVHITDADGWVYESHADSLSGAHHFVFWKQYSCVNGIQLRKGLNTGVIYSERTRLDHSGTPWSCDEDWNFLQIQGASDDTKWILDDARDNNRTDIIIGGYYDDAADFGPAINYLPTANLTLYRDGYAGYTVWKRVSANNAELQEVGTGNDSFLKIKHSDLAKKLFVTLDALRMRDSGGSTLRGFKQAYTGTINFGTVGAGAVVESTFAEADATAVKMVMANPQAGLPTGVMFNVYATSGNLVFRVHNTTGSGVAVSTGFHYSMWEIESN